MKNIFLILLIGFSLMGCGEDQNVEKNSTIDLPKSEIVTKSYSLNKLQKESLCNKKGGCEEDNSDSNSGSTDDSSDNGSSVVDDINAPEQNRDILVEPFDKIIDLFNLQYSEFPANSTHRSTENNVIRVIIDDNGIIHAIVSQIAHWWGKDRRGHLEEGMSRDFRYYYISYNYNTNRVSSAKKIFENKSLNSGNLPNEGIVDFIVEDNQPILITKNIKTNTIKRYMLNGSKTIIKHESKGYIFGGKLIKYNSKIYLFYQYDYDRNNHHDGNLMRYKKVEIYPTIGEVENIIDEDSMSHAKIYHNKIFFEPANVFFNLDKNFKAISYTKESIEKREKWFYGKVKLYDNSVKALLLSDDDYVEILNQDNSIDKLFHIETSRSEGSNPHISAAVFKDSIILAQTTKDEHKIKITTYNRFDKTIKIKKLGNDIYHAPSSNIVQNYIDINRYKQMVIGNIDGRYDYSAQITVALFPTNQRINRSEKEILLQEPQTLKYGYYRDEARTRWYISKADSSKKVTVYSLMPIKNGQNGWGVVGKDIATIDLDSNQITIGDIKDSTDNKYYIALQDETIISDKKQSDIEKIRNSTVSIDWWFFKASNGSWYIVNTDGKVYRFGSKKEVDENGNKSEVYDWKKIDLDNAVPNFYIENGVKKVKF